MVTCWDRILKKRKKERKKKKGIIMLFTAGLSVIYTKCFANMQTRKHAISKCKNYHFKWHEIAKIIYI